jgi:uncharacterized protein (TIGR03083 family)
MKEIESMYQLIKSESQRIVQYLEALPDEAWSKPSACDAWTVGDVVGHLVFVAEFYSENISRGVQGDTSASKFFSSIDFADRTALAKLLEQTSVERRKELGEQLLPTLVSEWDRFIGILGSLNPEDWERPCWRWTRPIPVRYHLPLSVQELVIHGWDIRSNLEPSPSLSEECLPLLVDRAIRRFRVITEHPDPLRASKSTGVVRYRFDVAGPVTGKHDMIIDDEQAHMEPAIDEKPDVIFRCDTVTFLLLMYQRLTAVHAIANGKMTAEGNEDLISDFENRRFERG